MTMSFALWLGLLCWMREGGREREREREKEREREREFVCALNHPKFENDDHTAEHTALHMVELQSKKLLLLPYIRNQQSLF